MYTPDQIRESDYEGWVAWIDGTPVEGPDGTFIGYSGATPLFEKVPHNPKLASLVTGQDEGTRLGARNTIDWNDLPHERVCQLQLYAFRDQYAVQPVVSLTPVKDKPHRWIQFKRRALTVPGSGKVHKAETIEGGMRRTAVGGYVIGYWMFDGVEGEMRMWEIPSQYTPQFKALGLEGINHPCWPKPLGFGLAPHVLGLKPADVPDPPTLAATAFGGAGMPAGVM